MKKLMNLNGFILSGMVVTVFTLSSSCTNEEVIPVSIDKTEELRIDVRTDLTNVAAQVRIKISERDNIPLSDIVTCYFNNMTSHGHYEYHFTTTHFGPGIYIVIGIIGDDLEGA